MTECSSIFNEKKARILESLQRPDNEYSDLSPKGSVDEGIQELIHQINRIDGLVTTSSCAGRISVFLEGQKNRGDGRAASLESVDNPVPGGKGLGGQWLYVSHRPVDLSAHTGRLSKLFNLPEPFDAHLATESMHTRLVQFQFEPMILHVLTASLRHAQIVLSAAIAAGFRESGLQSLKALDDSHALPMVAVRTAGLALSSVIACAGSSHGDGEIVTLVDEFTLRLLLREANGRFTANAERTARFERALIEQAERRRQNVVKEPRKPNGIPRLKMKEESSSSNRPDRSEAIDDQGLYAAAALFDYGGG